MWQMLILQRQGRIIMLATRRSFSVADECFRTPLIVPSYSSRAAEHDISDVIDVNRRFVSGPVLVSAYDVMHFGVKQKKLGESSLTFLDSGGYEAGKYDDFSEVEDLRNQKPSWAIDEYRQVLSKWNFIKPTVLVSFDNPNRREKLPIQIARARENLVKHPDACHTILLKSEPIGRALKKGERLYIHVDRISEFFDDIRDFSILGVTEKELGNSIFNRMKVIGKLRKKMNEHGVNIPIHVFGSLDPVTTPLFFLSGADIFDGLTWLRYAFYNKIAIYKQNVHAVDRTIPLSMQDGQLTASVHVNNYHYLGTMEEEMKQFLNNREWAAFGDHADFFRTAIERLEEEIGGQ